jgi:hypothetical protein
MLSPGRHVIGVGWWLKSRGRTWLTFCGLARKDTQPLRRGAGTSANLLSSALQCPNCVTTSASARLTSRACPKLGYR